jgi:hypothetical protein
MESRAVSAVRDIIGCVDDDNPDTGEVEDVGSVNEKTDLLAPDPFSAQISRVTGRNTVPGGRGLPKIAEIAITNADGGLIEAGIPDLMAAGSSSAFLVRPINPAIFPVCPICLDAPGNTREHVPPKPLGGVVMTNTCRPCNAKLGSRTESAMQDWFDVAFRIFYTRDGDRRHFGHDRVLLRKTTKGEFVLLHEKGDDESLGEALRHDGSVMSHQRWPHPNQYKNGLLKSAFLAACLSLGGVPIVPSADEIRAELLAARDTKRRAEVRLGPHAEALKAYRTGTAASGPPIALVRTEVDHEETILISLAGTLFVTWPFAEIDPRAQLTPAAA